MLFLQLSSLFVLVIAAQGHHHHHLSPFVRGFTENVKDEICTGLTGTELDDCGIQTQACIDSFSHQKQNKKKPSPIDKKEKIRKIVTGVAGCLLPHKDLEIPNPFAAGLPFERGMFANNLHTLEEYLVNSVGEETANQIRCCIQTTFEFMTEAGGVYTINKTKLQEKLADKLGTSEFYNYFMLGVDSCPEPKQGTCNTKEYRRCALRYCAFKGTPPQ